jgi:uncharacterized protein YgiB involved in biofilm formation
MDAGRVAAEFHQSRKQGKLGRSTIEEGCMKRSRTAALLLMSASPLLLTACGVEDVNTEGLYTSVDKCVEQTNDRYTCEEAFNQALAKAETDAPKYESREVIRISCR